MLQRRDQAGDTVLDLGWQRAVRLESRLGRAPLGLDVGVLLFGRSPASSGGRRPAACPRGRERVEPTPSTSEHLSPESLALTLREAARVLVPGGALFVYTHLRQRSPLAPVLDLERRLAHQVERWGLADLTLERLRPTDHVNPLADYADLRDTAAAAGFAVSSFRYYTPLLTRLIEGVMVPVAAHALARVAARRGAGAASGRGGTRVDRAALRTARVSAKRRIARRGPAYWILRALTAVVMLDVRLLGRLRSGPFFARLVKVDRSPGPPPR
jgi:hypothetical protein